ncbi:MAG: hypothetical protein BWY68_00496 [bacterium ADurb.Bin400]|nr:MAG: hypothetical protein BWY68_00496 [bacterium ADurb.Bin400]
MPRRQLKRGFGVLEVLISAAIIAIILGALVSIGRASVASSKLSLQRTQASYLAQEGIEILRQIRDSRWIDGDTRTTWDDFMVNADPIIANYLERPVNPVSSLTGTVRYYIDPNNNAYQTWYFNYGSGPLIIKLNESAVDTTDPFNTTEFSRTVVFSKVGGLLPDGGEANIVASKNAVKATVIVSWVYNGAAQSVTASEILTNWRPNY